MTEQRTQDLLPKHIAIVMDGNGRWAQQQGLPRTAGHEAGVKVAKNIIEHCAKQSISTLSLFAFSSENWQRPSEEINFLMQLFVDALTQYTIELHQENVRLQFIGEMNQLQQSLRTSIQQSQALTDNNTGMNLVIAINYGGRWDICQACQTLASKVAEGSLSVDAIDERSFERALTTADLPEPDLFIRTSGEQRLSNFYLWQTAYTELYFSPLLWPEFTPEQLDDALAIFAKRQRRFGKIDLTL
ncbi:MAG: isoprenyl transferase [Legionellales bacterium]|nr:isoprenyl transferase [Legionellales bacterium]